MKARLNCPDCKALRALKFYDIVNYGSYIKRLYECEVCKERYSSKETLLKKASSLIKPRGKR